DEVRVLDQAARDAGVLLLNECGFDPGIDHMTAVRTIRRFESRGARVTQFTSAAAGLPAPEANTNPWQYKFSWNPRAAILAARRDARFLRSGRIIEVAGSELHRYAAAHEVEGLGTMEMYPNRDSLFYRDLYGLRDAADVFRGTLRYPGWMQTIAAAARLGLLDETTRSWPVGTTWRDIAGRKLEGVDARAMERLRWAGFFSDEPIGRTSASALDLFVSRLEGILQYERGERDMALLQHRFEATFSDGTHERIEASLVTYGEANGDTAMSRLVGLPAAIAADLVLRRRIELTGVQIPVAPAIYEPLLEELEGQGVTATERKI
ncbi:MAG TPA: saccharopine dehydrogenase C-terminal domain-containing protein, partial [Thermoanaerobaculia bacterium]|nr:saccharopine dehydrogenase C-terminal domain-containing protein [Thermoanaerobaculia bacterium]